MVRNLSQYPITLEEKIDAMNWAVSADNTDWEASGQPIGDVRGVALAQIRDELRERDSEMKIWKGVKPHLGHLDNATAIRALADGIWRVAHLDLPPEKMAANLALFSGIATAALLDYAKLLDAQGKP